MSLSDLKKDVTRSKVSRCSVEDFIDDAESYARGYAKGYDNVVSITAAKAVSAVPVKAAKLPFRKATFTLSEACIESLATMSLQSGYAKSHLIRLLIQDKWNKWV